MFLQELKENEKKAFLELVHLVAKANGIITTEEQKMLDSYNKEMGVTICLEELEEKELLDIVGQFESNRSKRIVFLEALAVALADGDYMEDEKEFIKGLREAFAITLDEYEDFKGWIIKTNALYEQASELVNK